ncbi:N-acetylmuramoyl-L-alanine amidase CwlD [Bacillus sp. HMF5848]|uniref:N-acetylmuramoyl-L-alanine amidase CwlD n=1 Tax=Bacillus sp. HMF5848 TaxID=2495421 RepID=UPI000F7A0217|nr:N-acetylmuramoyl-L-alanine amidase CwlD [Bacillus sp. HMF5848]RSK25583.1 N-acetylmuramoyl-L-alanine amidase CwlD [Bacillus sp. HMF5848]
MKRFRILIGVFIVIICLFTFMQYQFRDQDALQSWNLPLSGLIIAIDPGHGGVDGGAVGGEDVYEKDIALSVSLKLRDYLQEQGALVLLTREDDRDLASPSTKGYRKRWQENLRNRVTFINESAADLFISVHLNAIPSSRWRGAQVFYNPMYKENKALAKAIQAEMIRNLENTDRSAKALQESYLLRKVEKPGALVEIGFLSNDAERNLLQTKAYQHAVAASIYTGIIKYIEKHPPQDNTDNE